MNRRERTASVGSHVLDAGLTADARDWIIAALDPFHDFERQLAGYPDTDVASTSVACYQFEIDVSKPVASVGNWDAHVFNLPLDRLLATRSYVATNMDYSGTAVVAPALPLVYVAPLTVIKADAGQPLFPTKDAPYNPTNLEQDLIDVSTSVGVGAGRVIAWGYEIVNTTAELYKQGALTVYKVPQSINDTVKFLNDAALNTTAGNVRYSRFRHLPSRPETALLLNGARQWSAADGVYAVCSQNSSHNPIMEPTSVPIGLSQHAPEGTGEYFMMEDLYWEPSAVSVLPASSLALAKPKRLLPFNSTGVMLTGLSPQTTLRIKMKMYVEKAPNFSDPQISVLASPSATYDPKALELFSKTISHLPIAVPVSMNAFGDWFKAVLQTVAKVAPAIGMLGGPKGMAIGGLVSLGAKTFADVMPEEKAQSNQKQETRAAVRKMNNDELMQMRQEMVKQIRSSLSGVKQLASKQKQVVAKKPAPRKK